MTFRVFYNLKKNLELRKEGRSPLFDRSMEEKIVNLLNEHSFLREFYHNPESNTVYDNDGYAYKFARKCDLDFEAISHDWSMCRICQKIQANKGVHPSFDKYCPICCGNSGKKQSLAQSVHAYGIGMSTEQLTFVAKGILAFSTENQKSRDEESMIQTIVLLMCSKVAGIGYVLSRGRTGDIFRSFCDSTFTIRHHQDRIAYTLPYPSFYVACEMGNKRVASNLLKMGLDANIQLFISSYTSEDETFLECCCAKNQREVLELILDQRETEFIFCKKRMSSLYAMAYILGLDPSPEYPRTILWQKKIKSAITPCQLLNTLILNCNLDGVLECLKSDTFVWESSFVHLSLSTFNSGTLQLCSHPVKVAYHILSNKHCLGSSHSPGANPELKIFDSVFTSWRIFRDSVCDQTWSLNSQKGFVNADNKNFLLQIKSTNSFFDKARTKHIEDVIKSLHCPQFEWIVKIRGRSQRPNSYPPEPLSPCSPPYNPYDTPPSPSSLLHCYTPTAPVYDTTDTPRYDADADPDPVSPAYTPTMS